MKMIISPVNVNINHPNYPEHVNQYILDEVKRPVNTDLLPLESEEAEEAFENEYRRWITGREEELF
jgi:hypothetical protein